MSSKNATSNSKRNAKDHSNESPSRTSNQKISSSIPPFSVHQKNPRETSSLIQPAVSTTAPPSSSAATRASSSRTRTLYSSYTTSASDFNTNRSNGFNANISSSFPHMQVDLLEMSAWTQVHPRQSPHGHQTYSPPYTSYDTTNTSVCPNHASTMDVSHDATRSTSGSGSGSVPLERWIKEEAIRWRYS